MAQTKQKMTIHRALAELKTLDSRISNAIVELSPYDFIRGEEKLTQTLRKTKEEFLKSVSAQHQSVSDLIKRKADIKIKIVESNANTKVTIAGKTMTVADAITMKSIIGHKSSLLSRIKRSKSSAIDNITQKNERVEEQLQKVLENTFGKDGVKTDSASVTEISDRFRKTNAFHLVEGISEKTIADLENLIEEFNVEVDAILSESNAVTFIEL